MLSAAALRKVALAVAFLMVSAAPAYAHSADARISAHATRHLLVIRIRGHHQRCLWPPHKDAFGNAPDRPTDTFELRGPTVEILGPLLARAVRATWTTGRCGINVTFKVRSNLGQFYMYDATSGDIAPTRRLPRLIDGQWTFTHLFPTNSLSH